MKKLWTGFVLFMFLCLPAYASAADARFPQQIIADNFIQVAEAEVEKELSDQGETRHHTLEVTKVPKILRLPNGNITYDVTIPNGLRYSLVVPVYITVKVDDVPYQQVICYLRIHMYETVIVAARSLSPNQQLTDTDVRLEEREVGNAAARYLTRVDDVKGLVTNRLVREGTLFTKTMLQNPVILEAGANVDILADINGVKIKTPGITLQRGRVGQLIRVRNADSQKVLRARVLDQMTVEVDNNE